MPQPSSDHPANVQSGASAPRLVGWKDIATFLGKAERTVKRWGKDRGLPIHRVPGGSSASVYAYPAELNKWLAATNPSDLEAGGTGRDPDRREPIGAAEVGAVDAALTTSFRKVARSNWLDPKIRWATVFLAFIAVALAFSVVHFRRPGVRVSDTSPSVIAKEQVKSRSAFTPTVSNAEIEQAREYYLKGRYEWNQRTRESLNRALDFFTQAIVHDPNYAQAYAGLADTYDLQREFSTTPDTYVFPRAIAAARKAVALDDSLPEAHRALAFAEMYGSWDFIDAEKEFRRAIELNPGDPQAHRWYANAFAVPGRFPDALDEISKSQELDPSSHATLADKGMMLYDAGRTKEAIETLKEVERSAPEFRSPHFYLMVISLDRKDYPTFLAEGQKSAEIMADPVLADIIASARAGYAKDGGRGLMNNLYARQKEYYSKGKLGATMLAKTCALMGRRLEAIQLLEEAYNRHETDVLACLSHPDLLTLKDEPRFKALVSKLNFPSHPIESAPNYISEVSGQPLPTLSSSH
jgi:tetratricopeptide (TPR) repeat protein